MNKALNGSICIAMVLASGCVVETSAALSGGVAVSGPPPEPVQEVRPSSGRPMGVWIAGYWHWTGMQYTWIPGHWEEGPPGARWRAPRYLLRDGVYYYEPGGWSAPPR
jgi:YXWGXW repeat-containing protein